MLKDLIIEIKHFILNIINKYINQKVINIFHLERFKNPKEFPFLSNLKNYINIPLIFKNKKYYSQLYNEPYEKKSIYAQHFLLEIIPGQTIDIDTVIEVKENSVIPISFQNNGIVKITDSKNNEKKLSGFKSKRYYYIKLNNNDKLKLENKTKAIVGTPIPLNKNSKCKPKLVLCIFIDGLSNHNIDLKSLMPNTYNFFSKGIIFNNCHTNSEWSLPSVANIFTGQYTHIHNVYHKTKKSEVGLNTPILSEYFQNQDYLTFNLGANFRKNPSYGYVKGFDRTLYKKDMPFSEILTELFEQLYSFENRDQFGWIDIFDLHRPRDINMVPNISCQTKYNNSAHIYNYNEKLKAVFSNYNNSIIERYINSIFRIDKYLEIFYNFIEHKYQNDEFILAVCSDHGQAYLSKENHPLSDNRIKVPFMIRGYGIKHNIISNNFIENVDILPILLNLLKIQYDKKNISGQLPLLFGGNNRKYIYSESIYTGQTFKAIVKDNLNKLYFESEYATNEKGKIILGNFKTKLLSPDNTEIHNKILIREYTDIILNKIKNKL